jgi:hypothetical protein
MRACLDTSRAPRDVCAAAAACLPACLQDDSVLLTASGDQHVGVWDTEAGRLKVYCAGHDGSVKVVTPHSSSHDVFASGARVCMNTQQEGAAGESHRAAAQHAGNLGLQAQAPPSLFLACMCTPLAAALSSLLSPLHPTAPTTQSSH